jgi:hypothetical protein
VTQELLGLPFELLTLVVDLGLLEGGGLLHRTKVKAGRKEWEKITVFVASGGARGA